MDNPNYATRDQISDLHKQANETGKDVVKLQTEMGFVRGDVGEIKTMMKEQQDARATAGAVRHKERTNRLWTWIAIMGSWVFALIGIILKR